MEKIKNYEVYNASMAKTMMDKVWFIDKIPANITTIVDFGCADGTLIKFVEQLFPKTYNFIGIDNDEVMRHKANKNLDYLVAEGRAKVVNSINDISMEEAENAVLVLNSVVHEISTYCSYLEAQNIWHSINDLHFGYVAIRDMHYQKNVDGIGKFRSAFFARGYHLTEWLDKRYYRDDDPNMIIEYLLKYRYRENWAREVNERYLWDWANILTLALDDYTAIIEDDFYIPFIFQQWEKDYSTRLATIPFNTHKKMLFRFRPYPRG